MPSTNSMDVVTANLEAWRAGRLEPPPWCCLVSKGPDDYCWTWVSGFEARREGCRDCESCLGQNGPDTWRPPAVFENGSAL